MINLDEFNPIKKIKPAYAHKKVNDKFYGTISIDPPKYNLSPPDLICWNRREFGEFTASCLSDKKKRQNSFGLYKEIPGFFVTFQYEGESVYVEYED